MQVTHAHLKRAINRVVKAKRSVVSNKKALEIFHLLSMKLKNEKKSLIEAEKAVKTNLVEVIVENSEQPYSELFEMAKHAFDDLSDGDKLIDQINRQIEATQEIRLGINRDIRSAEFVLANFRDIILSSILNDFEDNAYQPINRNVDPHLLLETLVADAQMILDVDFDAGSFLVAEDLLRFNDFHKCFTQVAKATGKVA